MPVQLRVVNLTTQIFEFLLISLSMIEAQSARVQCAEAPYSVHRLARTSTKFTACCFAILGRNGIFRASHP